MELSLTQMLGVYCLGFLAGLGAFGGFLALWQRLKREGPMLREVPESRSTGPVIVPSVEPMVCENCLVQMESDGRAGWKCPECGKGGLKLRVTRMSDEVEWERERMADERAREKAFDGGKLE